MLAHAASLLLLAFAVSLDGFGVGVTYGLRRIRIPLLSIFIIACCSGIVIFLSMQVGGWLTGFLNEIVARIIGASLLIAIGCWALLQLRRSKQGDGSSKSELKPGSKSVKSESKSEREEAVVQAGARSGSVEITHTALVVMVELKRLGLVIQILRTPQAADVDKSGVISSSEAIMLGAALSLDAFGAGLGAAMIGLPALLTSFIITGASAVFLLGGLRFGFRFSSWKGMRSISFLPGIILIVMGIMKLL